jgi:hypothetical protein
MKNRLSDISDVYIEYSESETGEEWNICLVVVTATAVALP